MRIVAWVLGLVIVLPVAVLAGWIGFGVVYGNLTELDKRFRLTLEIDTPEGGRSGSSVIRVTRWDGSKLPLSGLGNPMQHRVEGEAVVAELAGGRLVIALLAHGPRGDDSDRMISLWTEAHLGWGGRWDEAFWSGGRELAGVAELKGHAIPTIITFEDVTDPTTAKVLHPTRPEAPDAPDAFAATLGPGHALRRMTLEMVPKTTPLTRGIEERLPVMLAKLRELDSTLQTVAPGDPLRVRSGHLSIK